MSTTPKVALVECDPFLLRRAFRRIDISSDGCWRYTGSLNERGYAQLRFRGRTWKGHRAMWTYFRGPIPEGLQVDHLCRVRSCVNPLHLELVTNRENSLRGIGLTSVNAKKTQCDRGHEFTVANTYRKAGRRHCRACRSMARARFDLRAAS